jgi:hypothetical protein
MSQDPEVQRLAATTARVYAKAGILAEELDKTVNTLQSFMREKPPAFEPYPQEGETA